MDPEQVFNDMLRCVTADDIEGAADKYDDLLSWIERDGFLPSALSSCVDDLVMRLSETEAYPWEENPGAIDFRIYIRPNGCVELCMGEGCYDTDLRGYCGAAMVNKTCGEGDVTQRVLAAFDEAMEGFFTANV